MKQITNTIMMIEPLSFGYNEQTAVNNYYQRFSSNTIDANVQDIALIEFNNFVQILRHKGVNVIVIKSNSFDAPDSIFPNNWISTHSDGSIFLYPMFAKNRRIERRPDIIDYLKKNFIVKNVFNNTSFYESNNLFLEGTGSMVLDRKNKIAYSSISERTNQELVEKWCSKMNFSSTIFTSYQSLGKKKEIIYHTNVMMCVADEFAIICLESIHNKIERNKVINCLHKSGKEIIDISEEQTSKFAGNMLQVMGHEKYLIMSDSALKSLNDNQKERIKKYNKIVHINLETIELFGGGSARCMMTEIFLQIKE